MGMDIMFLSFKDGEIPVNPLIVVGGSTINTPYFGGMPAAIHTTGQAILALGGTPAYLGMFKNSSYEDLLNGNATIVHGASKVVFMNGSNEVDTIVNGVTVEGAPYNTALTYVAGEYLYVTAATGLWTNSSGGNGTPKGIITKPATSTDSTMQAYMFSVV